MFESGEENVTYEEKDVLLDGTHIEGAAAQTQQTAEGKEEYLVSLTFTEEGAKIFSHITSELIGEQLCIVSDDKVIFAPLVQTEITGGTVMISGDFQTEKEASQDFASNVAK